MNRGLRTLVVVLIAVVMAALATYGAFRVIQQMPVRQVQTPKAAIVVARTELSVGMMLGKEDLKTVDWPADLPVKGGFADPEQVIGRGLIASVAENEPVTETKLAPRESGAGLPPTIPQGMRALSVRVNEVIGVAGFVVPGTKVDVLVTIGDREKSATRTVVSNVLVLTAGSRYDQERATKEGKPIQATVVTLALSPEDTEKVALATAEGQVMLSLRNPLDTAPTDTKGMVMSALLGGAFAAPPPQTSGPARPRPAAAAPPTAVAPSPRLYTVEAIRGAKRTEEVIR